MSDWITLTLIILSELALLQMIGLGIYAWRKNLSRSAKLKSARKLLLSLRDDPQHADALRAFLRSTYGLEEAELETSSAPILADEEKLTRTVLKSIATNNLSAIIPIREQIAALIHHGGPWTETLKNKHIQHTQKLETIIQTLQVDLEKLRGELESTLTTMERTLSEYANMYSVKTSDDDKGLAALRGVVSNATQHATHTLKKLAEALEDNKAARAASFESAHPDDVGLAIDIDKELTDAGIDLTEPELLRETPLNAKRR